MAPYLLWSDVLDFKPGVHQGSHVKEIISVRASIFLIKIGHYFRLHLFCELSGPLIYVKQIGAEKRQQKAPY